MKTLIVGGGSIGERHLRCFQQTPPCVVSLCEIRDDLRLRLHEQYQLTQSFASVDEAARHPWDVVVICTPAHLHVRHALAFAPQTRGLLIEKPLATKVDEIPRLIQGVQQNIVGVAYVMRAHPAIQQARALLHSGALGELHQLTIVNGQHFPTYRPAYREIYYNNRETGGGAIQDAITHLCDLVQFLAGDFNWVFCDSAHLMLPGVTVEDTVHLTGRAAQNRVMVNLALNQFMAPNESYIHLNAAQGTIEFRMHESRWGVLRHGQADWEWHPFPLQERDDLFRLQAAHFVKAVQGEAPVLCTLEEAHRTLFVNLANLASNGERKILL